MNDEIDRSERAPRDEYTHGHHESVLRSHTWRTAENSAGYLLPHLSPGLDLLDVGSGPGTITVDFARRVAPGRVVGLDASEDIVSAANELAVQEGVANARFVTGDAYALDFDDESFDVVHSHQLLQHLLRPVDALREFARVLRPGGVLAVREVDYGGVIWHPPSLGLDRWREVYRAVHRWNGGEPDAGRTLKAWVLQAGFTEVEAGASIWHFSSPVEREWWGTSWASRALESTFATHAIKSENAEPGDLQEISQAWRDWSEREDGWFAMPHGEVIARKR